MSDRSKGRGQTKCSLWSTRLGVGVTTLTPEKFTVTKPRRGAKIHYASDNRKGNVIIKSKRMRWTGHVARMGEKSNAYRILVGKPEGKRPLGRPRRRWDDNIRMDLREIGWCGMD
jgi:hypothetical protein